jgi:DNA-binding beta-propeller fold protein YncE
MNRIWQRKGRVVLALGAFATASVWGQTGSYVNFEGRQVRSICLSPDGTRLFAVNTPDARVSVFDISNPVNPVPVLIREIPVGVEPVSVNALSSEEAWVVNEISDSVSVVSVSAGMVTATLPCKDEPGDVVFASGKAFVSCSGNNLIRVFDSETYNELATIPLEGLAPRSLAVSNDDSKVYTTFLLSGNRTTLLPPDLAPPQPPATNISDPPPQVGLIVAADDIRLNPQPNMPDNDVAEVDVATHAVTRYFQAAGTVNFWVSQRPGTDELWVANTEARNLVRFETVLRGHSVDNRVTRIETSNPPTVTPFDLNPGIDYSQFPNNAAKTIALAQPTAITFEADGSHFWLASYGTDRVARVDATNGAVVERIETGPTVGTAANPREKRGARALVLKESTSRLYIMNRISNTISVVSTSSGTVLAETPVGSHDPTPEVIREGRGFLYDARLSSTGTQSCASCHIDGDRDELAWDLGDPDGFMQTVSQTGPLGTQNFNMHPMKGPMTTQTLKGLTGHTPLHWRGDRDDFTQFNGAFASLLGGSTLSAEDMQAFRDFIHTMVFQPNPNQNLDRTLPNEFPAGAPEAGDPNAGLNTYINEAYQPQLTCNTCHSLPTGTNNLIIPAAALQESQDFKVPHLRNVYQKRFFKKSATDASLSGFGIVHDGLDPDLFTFLSRPVFGVFSNDTVRKRNINAFIMCLDTGTAPAVGYARTFTATSLPAAGADWTLLEGQAASANIDLIVFLKADGERHSLLYRPGSDDYESDDATLGVLTRSQIESMAGTSSPVTVMGVPSGSGNRFALDRDQNGTPNGDELMPALVIEIEGGLPQLAWPSEEASMVLEFTESLDPANWQVVTHPRTMADPEVQVEDSDFSSVRIYRLRTP